MVTIAVSGDYRGMWQSDEIRQPYGMLWKYGSFPLHRGDWAHPVIRETKGNGSGIRSEFYPGSNNSVGLPMRDNYNWQGTHFVAPADDVYALFVSRTKPLLSWFSSDPPSFTVEVEWASTLTDAEKNIYAGRLVAAVNLAREAFEMQEYVIAIERCGEINARYDPNTKNIVICSELFAGAQESGALEGVLFHEIGHKVFDHFQLEEDETKADLFSFGLLMQFDNGISLVHDYAKFLAKKNPYTFNHFLGDGTLPDVHPSGDVRTTIMLNRLKGAPWAMVGWANEYYRCMRLDYLYKIKKGDAGGAYKHSELASAILASQGY